MGLAGERTGGGAVEDAGLPGTRLGLRACACTRAYTYTRVYTCTYTQAQAHVCAPHPDAVRADHVAHWATRTHGIEGPARHQGEGEVGGRRLLRRTSEGLPIESRSRRGRCPRDLTESQTIPARIGDLEGGNAVGDGDAVRAFDLDAVAAAQPGQRAEVGIAMAADHGGARVTGKNARRVVPGAERQAATGIPRQDNKGSAQSRNHQPSHRPSIRPGPGPGHGFAAGRPSLLPCRIQQVLSQLRLGVDPRAADQLPSSQTRQHQGDRKKKEPARRPAAHDHRLRTRDTAQARASPVAPIPNCSAAGVEPWAKRIDKPGAEAEATGPGTCFCTQRS